MKASLHLTSGESTPIHIDIPEAQALAGAHVNIYSNIDHVIWEATRSGVTVQHVSTSPTPGASLHALATKLHSVQANQASSIH
jgi:hypothetical protein